MEDERRRDSIEEDKRRRDSVEGKNVFISWTRKDFDKMDAIKLALVNNGITVLTSDEQCDGNFADWSVSGASACDVFIIILTETSVSREMVMKEFISAVGVENSSNRIIPVCVRSDLTKEAAGGQFSEFWLPYVKRARETANPDKEHEKAWDDVEHISLPTLVWSEGLTDNALNEIVRYAKDLIVERACDIYRRKTKPDFIKLIAMCKQDFGDRHVDRENLYIPRRIKEDEEDGEKSYVGGEDKKTNTSEKVYDTPDELFEGGVYYIHAVAGMGKSEYCGQIAERLGNGGLCIVLPCADCARSDKPFDELVFEQFKRELGNMPYFTKDNFGFILDDADKKIVLVLDGLDEIATVCAQNQLVNKVEDYLNAKGRDISVVFTGREKGRAKKLSFGGRTTRSFTLLPLGPEEIMSLGKNLFVSFGHGDKAESFFVSLSAVAEEISSNPLLLSQMAIIYDEQNKIPQTVEGILEKITQIILNKNDLSGTPDAQVPNGYEGMMYNLGAILESLAKTQYESRFGGEEHSAKDLLCAVLSAEYKYVDAEARAKFLADYLSSRSIFVNEEFVHKMFAEYFTAVYYYKRSFSPLKKLNENHIVLELFKNYSSPYWENVIKLFCAKVDSLVGDRETEKLYDFICNDVSPKITEYTLLFDLCADLLNNKTLVQTTVLKEILSKSADKTYAPYGPLFWYVPKYDLYEPLALSAEKLIGDARALALTRDVCFITGHYSYIGQVTDKVDGERLYAEAKNGLSAERDVLCKIFCLKVSPIPEETDICPRCFDPFEAYTWRAQGCGRVCRNHTPFSDTLGLFEHQMLSEHCGEYMGMLSFENATVTEETEKFLSSKSTYRVTVLSFGLIEGAEDNVFSLPRFYKGGVKEVYFPENDVFDTDDDRPYKIEMPRLEMPRYGCSHYGDGLWRFDVNHVVIPPYFKIIPEYAFYECVDLRSVTIPYGVTEIGRSAFLGCESLTSIEIPESVTEIGTFAFNGCIGLTSIIIPDGVKKIGWSVFEDCRGLTSIEIPESVTEIGSVAFSGCSGLTSIEIPESVTIIGDDAFAHCSGLTSIEIPKRVTKIGTSAFSRCSSLTSVKVPNGVKEIGWRVFEDCRGLTSIEIPESVTKIEDFAFARCSGLTSIEIPESVTEIGESAFEGCVGLKKIRLPRKFRDELFDLGIVESAEVFFDDDNAAYIVESDFVQTFVIPDGVKTVNRKDVTVRNMRSVILPESVTEIGFGTFADCSSLTAIEIPESVTKIWSSAFEGCLSLTSIKIPNGVTEIGSSVFEGCRGLTLIEMPESVKKIGWGAFQGCSSLTSINIPVRVTEINPDAFKDCRSLISINIPNGVEIIGFAAFQGCNSLTAIKIPSGVTGIGGFAFKGCTGLTSIEIPESVTKIYSSAFSGCSSLESILLSKNLETIGERAFENCSALNQIDIPDGVCEIGDNAFSGCAALERVTIGSNFKNDIRRIFGDIDLKKITFI